jgi:hypothetical protein
MVWEGEAARPTPIPIARALRANLAHAPAPVGPRACTAPDPPKHLRASYAPI